MAIAAANSQPTGNWPQVRTGPLIVGGAMIGAGAGIALVGMAIAGSHLISATRHWMQELETPPAQLAMMKWEQARTAATAGAAAGASTWRTHPNAKVRLARRDVTPL
jgi:hypothetical protein